MNGPVYDTLALIENIKRRCSVPSSQLTYTDEDFALLANDSLQGEVVPLLMSTREEYFVDFIDIPMPGDRVIPFPDNTVASKVRSVCYVQNTSPQILINIPRVDLDVVAGVGFNNFNTLAGFYIRGNDLVFYPNTSIPVNTAIRIFYYKRTDVLAAPSQYCRIREIDVPSKTVIVDQVPNGWVSGTRIAGQNYKTPFDIKNSLITVDTVSNPSIILSSVEGLSVGDFLSEEGFAACPQVPIEAHPYLAQLTAIKCLEGLGDIANKQSLEKTAETLKKGLLIMLTQRVDGSVKKLVNPTGGLRLGAGLGKWGRGWSGGSW